MYKTEAKYFGLSCDIFHSILAIMIKILEIRIQLRLRQCGLPPGDTYLALQPFSGSRVPSTLRPNILQQGRLLQQRLKTHVCWFLSPRFWLRWYVDPSIIAWRCQISLMLWWSFISIVQDPRQRVNFTYIVKRAKATLHMAWCTVKALILYRFPSYQSLHAAYTYQTSSRVRWQLDIAQNVYSSYIMRRLPVQWCFKQLSQLLVVAASHAALSC